MMEGLTLAQLTTVAGIASATALLDEVLWRTLAASEAAKDRFGPIAALTTGVVVAVLASLVLGIGGPDLAQGVVNGAVGGLAAIGIHDLFKTKAGA